MKEENCTFRQAGSTLARSAASSSCSRRKVLQHTDSFRVTSSCPFHKSPSLCSVGGSWNWITFWNWSPCLTRAWQLTPLLLPANHYLVEVSAHSALWKSILLLQFSLFLPGCQLLASLQVWLLPPHSDIALLSFAPNSLIP